ncbi:hypothetical protein VST7929_00203 [Vibrio stylophorae]|uniref:Hemolysin n=1 Tax=Vibrio stylophorae TaxID=659351 RepID=A0ABN8DMN7_9VIBR|nr:hemolysin family protein [Vibrio stylophorae]CAH0532374.1 hypothetical protein VST7929_00203 [Vibrio stylophorae]
MLLLAVYITAAIGVSFICSILEAVLLSITPSYIATLRQHQDPAAPKLSKLKADIDRPLASILTLNTIAHTAGAAGAGAQASTVFGSEWLGLFSAILTLGILFLSEILPKTIGATYWRQLAPWTARMLEIMVWCLRPFVWLSEQVTSRLSRGKQDPKLRDELSAMALMASETGELAEDESRILGNLLMLREVNVTKVMTPRTVLMRVPASQSVDQFLSKNAKTPFSRILVYGDHKDDILGFVHRLEVFAYHHRREGNTPLSELMRPLPVLMKSVSLPRCFDILMKARSQLGLVVDEYGDVQGLVTLEDIFEQLLGQEIVDEADRITDMQKLAHKRWAMWQQTHGLRISDDTDLDELDDKANHKADLNVETDATPDTDVTPDKGETENSDDSTGQHDDGQTDTDKQKPSA